MSLNYSKHFHKCKNIKNEKDFGMDVIGVNG